MKPISIQLHPLVLAAILAVALPSIAIAAGTILSQPVTTTGSNTGAVLTATNTGSGPAVRAVGQNGQGVVGITSHNSTAASNGTAGVIGTDNSSSGAFNNGVNGFSSRGIGVAGGSNTGIGVRGISTNNVGVRGISTNGLGVYGLTGNQSKITAGLAAVFGDSFSSDGVIGTSSNGSGVEGVSTNGFGVYAVSTNGPGVEAHSLNYYGANISGGFNDSKNGYFDPALTVIGDGSKDLIDACPGPSLMSFCHSGAGLGPAVFQVDQSGNITIAGQVFTAGSCSMGCVPTSTSAERRVRFYTPSESLPTVEDFGTVELIAGQAYVRLDPAFVSTTDQRSDYMVFITPEGDSRGLYVTAKTSMGFEVRENQGGRSTLAISYRIVAKPYGVSAVRLQRITVGRSRGSAP